MASDAGRKDVLLERGGALRSFDEVAWSDPFPLVSAVGDIFAMREADDLLVTKILCPEQDVFETLCERGQTRYRAMLTRMDGRERRR